MRSSACDKGSSVTQTTPKRQHKHRKITITNHAENTDTNLFVSQNRTKIIGKKEYDQIHIRIEVQLDSRTVYLQQESRVKRLVWRTFLSTIERASYYDLFSYRIVINHMDERS